MLKLFQVFSRLTIAYSGLKYMQVLRIVIIGAFNEWSKSYSLSSLCVRNAVACFCLIPERYLIPRLKCPWLKCPWLRSSDPSLSPEWIIPNEFYKGAINSVDHHGMVILKKRNGSPSGYENLVLAWNRPSGANSHFSCALDARRPLLKVIGS